MYVLSSSVIIIVNQAYYSTQCDYERVCVCTVAIASISIQSVTSIATAVVGANSVVAGVLTAISVLSTLINI